jgi:hypothetical protein
VAGVVADEAGDAGGALDDLGSSRAVAARGTNSPLDTSPGRNGNGGSERGLRSSQYRRPEPMNGTVSPLRSHDGRSSPGRHTPWHSLWDVPEYVISCTTSGSDRSLCNPAVDAIMRP